MWPLLALGAVLAGLGGAPAAAAANSSALSAVPIPMRKPEELPRRTPPLIEIGPDFLGTGNLPKGIELPTGAVWLPALWVFGSYRTALAYFDSGRSDARADWSNRLDLFANLRLSGTERILFGVRPLHRATSYTGYRFAPDSEEGGYETAGFHVSRLFFEGEVGEIFPNLDPEDSGALDIGFSVGRQPLFFQEGMMINDTMDVVSVTRDTVIIPGLSVDTRFSALFAWNDVNRDNNAEDSTANLLGLFTEGDWGDNTVQFDLAYVTAENDGLYFGAGLTRRLVLLGRTINADFRVNTSIALDRENAQVSDGTLLFTQLSTTPPGADNVLYLDAFWGIDSYSSAARDNGAGGPLGQTGILFAAVGLGDYGAAMSNRADDVVGAALGYQMFFNDERTQLIFEIGGRLGTRAEVENQAAVGARLEQAIGARFILRLDGFVSVQENGDPGVGARTEFVTQF